MCVECFNGPLGKGKIRKEKGNKTGNVYCSVHYLSETGKRSGSLRSRCKQVLLYCIIETYLRGIIMSVKLGYARRCVKLMKTIYV
jgi:hypothetical protein